MDVDSATLPAVVPAGWYPDPAGSPDARWWDGLRWTSELRSPVPAPTSSVPAAFTVSKTSAYVPFQSEQRITAASVPRGTSYTRAGWWIAASPIWSLLPQSALLALFGSFSDKPGATLPLAVVAVSIVGWIILVALSFADAAGLRTGGNRSTGSPLWMLLSPLAYLIARAFHIARWDSSPWGLLIWFIVASVVAPVVAVLAYFATLGILP
jgi:hypothetical protein